MSLLNVFPQSFWPDTLGGVPRHMGGVPVIWGVCLDTRGGAPDTRGVHPKTWGVDGMWEVGGLGGRKLARSSKHAPPCVFC